MIPEARGRTQMRLSSGLRIGFFPQTQDFETSVYIASGTIPTGKRRVFSTFMTLRGHYLDIYRIARRYLETPPYVLLESTQNLSVTLCALNAHNSRVQILTISVDAVGLHRP